MFACPLWLEIHYSHTNPCVLRLYSYTSKYFSALIINREIESVIQADAKSVLAEDENFTVKAMKAANEISAIYRVDDQNMEMAIRLPHMFPLRKVEVNGIQKVGVKEDRWRAWLLAVSAIIASQVSRTHEQSSLRYSLTSIFVERQLGRCPYHVQAQCYYAL
jgi:hypothetical protein